MQVSGPSRGYILEVFNTHFQLPNLGPIGDDVQLCACLLLTPPPLVQVPMGWLILVTFSALWPGMRMWTPSIMYSLSFKAHCSLPHRQVVMGGGYSVC